MEKAGMACPPVFNHSDPLARFCGLRLPLRCPAALQSFRDALSALRSQLAFASPFRMARIRRAPGPSALPACRSSGEQCSCLLQSGNLLVQLRHYLFNFHISSVLVGLESRPVLTRGKDDSLRLSIRLIVDGWNDKLGDNCQAKAGLLRAMGAAPA